MADVSYGRTGIYLIVGAIVVPLVSAIFRMITPSQGRFFNYLLLLGFTYLTLYALHFHFLSRKTV